ncbi:Sodium/hydrogen exchanger 3 [Liparis tanakae]|uniref:Sodium/hydrogen exchanger 3 n=1 Tax=Liparis tanakae TaxID=230148 RepID=A0A4Z2FCE9_9TELE|nr:Sodium/hydrogen exchanger 3 [Liparis tanakae]
MLLMASRGWSEDTGPGTGRETGHDPGTGDTGHDTGTGDTGHDTGTGETGHDPGTGQETGDHQGTGTNSSHVSGHEDGGHGGGPITTLPIVSWKWHHVSTPYLVALWILVSWLCKIGFVKYCDVGMRTVRIHVV